MTMGKKIKKGPERESIKNGIAPRNSLEWLERNMDFLFGEK